MVIVAIHFQENTRKRKERKKEKKRREEKRKEKERLIIIIIIIINFFFVFKQEVYLNLVGKYYQKKSPQGRVADRGKFLLELPTHTFFVEFLTNQSCSTVFQLLISLLVTSTVNVLLSPTSSQMRSKPRSSRTGS